MRETDREKDKHRQTGGKTQLHLQTDTRSCARTHRHINASQYSAHKTHRPWGATFFTNHPLFPNLSFVKLMWRLWETIRVGMDFFISECVLLTPGSAVAQNWSKTGTDKDSKLSADQNFQAFGIFYLASSLSRHERRTFAPVVSQLWQTRRTARAAGGVTWDAPASAVSTLQLLPISIIWCHDWGHHGASRGPAGGSTGHTRCHQQVGKTDCGELLSLSQQPSQPRVLPQSSSVGCDGALPVPGVY